MSGKTANAICRSRKNVPRANKKKLKSINFTLISWFQVHTSCISGTLKLKNLVHNRFTITLHFASLYCFILDVFFATDSEFLPNGPALRSCDSKSLVQRNCFVSIFFSRAASFPFPGHAEVEWRAALRMRTKHSTASWSRMPAGVASPLFFVEDTFGKFFKSRTVGPTFGSTSFNRKKSLFFKKKFSFFLALSGKNYAKLETKKNRLDIKENPITGRLMEENTFDFSLFQEGKLRHFPL